MKYSKGEIIQSVYSDFSNVIPYIKEIRNITKSALSVILLSQIMYWYKKKKGKFYKFKLPCNNPKYKLGDSWCEELNFSREEFDNALKNIGYKITKKSIAQDAPEMKEALVWYNTDINRLTWYELNEENLQKKLAENHDNIETLRKAGLPLYVKSESHFSLKNTETTTTDTFLSEKVFSKEKTNILASQDDVGPGNKVSKGIPIDKRNSIENSFDNKTNKTDKTESLGAAIIRHKSDSKPKKKRKVLKTYQDHCKEHPKAKYTHHRMDYVHYNQLTSAGATKHKEEGKAPMNNTMDALHALFDPKCKMPYANVELANDPTIINHEWTIDEVIKAFKYNLEYANKPVKNIANFIMTKPFNNSKAWSPLLSFHQKMKRTDTGNGSLVEGKQFWSACKRVGIDCTDWENRILNNVGKKIQALETEYEFVNSSASISYPMGIIDYFVKVYLKEKLNDSTFRYVWINKKDFISEFIAESVHRNALKKKRIV